MSYSVREFQQDNAINQRRIDLVLRHFPEAMYEVRWTDGPAVFTADRVVPTDVLAVSVAEEPLARRAHVRHTTLFFPYQKLQEEGIAAHVFDRDPMLISIDACVALSKLKERSPAAYAALVDACSGRG